MACDQLVSAEVVLVDGRIVTCSRDSEPDLFWALRGSGGGSFGIVTRLESAPVTISRLVGFTPSWSWEHAADVLAGWQGWVTEGSDELGTALGIALPTPRSARSLSSPSPARGRVPRRPSTAPSMASWPDAARRATAGPDGEFDWTVPDEEVFRSWIDESREVGVHLLGRRLYETMQYWETADQDPSLDESRLEWAATWKPLPKVVFSTTLSAVQGNARLASGGLAEEIERAPGESRTRRDPHLQLESRLPPLPRARSGGQENRSVDLLG